MSEPVQFNEANNPAPRHIFQFISHEDGRRSEPFTGTYRQLADVIRRSQEAQNFPAMEDLVLLVATCTQGDEEQMHIPHTPLVTVETLLNYFEGKQRVKTDG